jgi:PAS domain S-box-containing protein
MKHRNEPTPKMDDRVYSVLVTQIYARVYIGIVGTIANASILVLILWSQIPHWKLLSWFYIMLLFSLIRIFQNVRFRKVADVTHEIRRWGRLLIIGLGAVGILWGSAAIFLFPAESLAHQAFMAFVLAGMVAGAVGTFFPIMPAFLAFSIPALAVLAIRFVVIGDQIHMAMGAMTALFAILTFTTAKRTNSSIKELVVLKETFADRLEERTAELKHVNKQLQLEIEERTQAEQALADSKRRLTDIIDFLPDPTWVIDIDGHVIAWNRAIEGITGIDKQDIIGKSDYAYSLPFYGRRRPALIDLVLKRNKQWEEEYLTIREENGLTVFSESFHPSMGDGGRYLAATASRLYDAQGSVVGAIESVRDITSAKRTEKDRERLIAELQKVVAEVRTLSGLLPICSSCKKIRDDKGYWNQIETYIGEHSNAEFSHSLCPECAKKLYPYLTYGD